MPLPNQKFDYPFDAGLDQEVDQRIVPQNLLAVENGVWNRDKRPEKREGQSDVLAEMTSKGQQSVVVEGEHVMVIGQNDVEAPNEDSGIPIEVSQQTTPEIARLQSVQSTNDVKNADTCIIKDRWLVTAYWSSEQGSNARDAVFFQIIDRKTGNVVVPEQLVEQSSAVFVGHVQVQAVGDSAHIYYLKDVGGGQYDLRLAIIETSPFWTQNPTSTLVTISAAAVGFSDESLWFYDSSSQSGLNSVVAYWNTDATPALETKRVSEDGLTVDTVTTAVAQAANRGTMAIYARSQVSVKDSVGAIILYQEEIGVDVPHLITINTAYTAVANGPTSTTMPVLAYQSFFLSFLHDFSVATSRRFVAIGNEASLASPTLERIEMATCSFDLSSITLRAQPLWGRVCAKPYWYSSQKRGASTSGGWLVLPIQKMNDVDAQPNIILVAIYGLIGSVPLAAVAWGALPIGRLNVDTAQYFYNVSPRSTINPVRVDESTGNRDTTKWLATVLIQKNLRGGGAISTDTVFEARPDLLTIDHGVDFPVRYAQSADNAYIAGGHLLAFTGGVIRDQAFHFRPLIEDVSAVGNPSGVEPGTYNYVCVYESYDERGEVIRSSPSEAEEIVLGAASTVTVEFRLPVYVTSPHDAFVVPPARVAIFRTKAGGSLFFRLATLPARPATAGPYTQWPTLTYTDVRRDNLLLEPLYSDAQLPADPSPAPFDVAVFQERVAIISGQARDEVWISKQKEPDVSAEFSAVQKVLVSGGRGDLTALASMDEKLILFKQDAIYAITGEGPNAVGQGTYAQAREVSSDIGCVNKCSVVVSEAGVFFESDAGIYLLDRGLNLQYIGGPVIDLVPGLGRLIARAVSVQPRKEIYFLLQGTNVVLCYNYRWGRWSDHYLWTQTNSTPDLSPTIAPQDLAVTAERLTVLHHRVADLESVLTRTKAGSYVDSIAIEQFQGIRFKLKTPWFKMAGLLGWQRTRNLRFLAEYASAHTLTIRTYHDYDNTTPTGTWTFADGVLSPVGVGGAYSVKVKLPNQKSQAVRFEFEATDLGAAYKALSLMLEYGVKASGVPVAVARKE